jgi:cytochrome c peroxidase
MRSIMLRRCSYLAFLAGMLTLTACQRAQMYQVPGKPPAVSNEKDDAELRRLSWTEQQARHDLPIVFVAESDAEWPGLKSYWNTLPFPAGMPMAHLGQAPLGAVAALVLTDHYTPIKIKVPRGLPDPTPNIPAANPPTFGKWRLGKTLFFKPILKAGAAIYSCNSCHDPRHGFAEDKLHPEGGKYNTLSLLNVAYNRRQFWDGRVETLEETLVRSFEDERPVSAEKSREKALEQHIWGGFVRELAADPRLSAEFKLVFGVDQPTQNSTAQALATYLRTLLSGDSLHDQADAVRRQQNAETLTAEHFRAVLKDESAVVSLRDHVDSKTPTREEMPALLQKGHELFHGKAGCVACHRGPLFTDHDYHNIGYEGEEGEPAVGVETGRSVHVPVGLKEWRLIGAFRTPSLRNLNRTAPHFHNGSHATLRDVVGFYNGGVLPSLYLAAPLKDADVPGQPRRLNLTDAEKAALVIYLRSLQGGLVDAVLLTQAN